MLTPEPGLPSDDVTCTPATRPAKASSNERTGALLRSATDTVATAPVKSFLFEVPYPITTTSSRSLICEFRLTFITDLVPTVIVVVSKPTYEKTNWSFAVALILNSPLPSVCVAVFDPLIETVTPGSVSL